MAKIARQTSLKLAASRKIIPEVKLPYIEKLKCVPSWDAFMSKRQKRQWNIAKRIQT